MSKYFSTKIHKQNARKVTICQTFWHNLRIAPRTSCVSDVSLATSRYPFFREIVPRSGETMSYFYTQGFIEDIYMMLLKSTWYFWRSHGTSDGSLGTSDGSHGTYDSSLGTSDGSHSPTHIAQHVPRWRIGDVLSIEGWYFIIQEAWSRRTFSWWSLLKVAHLLHFKDHYLRFGRVLSL